MGKTYRPYEPDQMFLLPPALKDWLPDGHLAYFISDVVDELDLSSIVSVYEREARGYPPYHPVMLVKILLYGYSIGIASSRRIARACVEDVAFRVLAANNMPDFRTISDFRKRHLAALKGLFVQVLRLCQEAGLVKLGHVALDGSKMKANASKHKAMSYDRMRLKEKELKEAVEALLRRAEKVDEEEDRRYGKDFTGDELPKELAFRESRLKKIREARLALEREAKEEAKGKQVHSGKSADAKKVVVPDSRQRNFTDPESRIMVSTTTKGFEQAYNCQAAVDTRAQVVVASEVTQDSNDKLQLPIMLAQVWGNTKDLPRELSADAGYWNEREIRGMWGLPTEFFIPPDKQRHSRKSLPVECGRIPGGLSFGDRMRRKLHTKKGKRAYGKRKETVEPVFGQIKQARGFRQFLLRGLEKVRGEWSLICTTHNLLKLWRQGTAQFSRN